MPPLDNAATTRISAKVTFSGTTKYCGGIGALLRIAEFAAQHNVQTAPHNPTGPICNFASLHTCIAGTGCDFLELQVGESELFANAIGVVAAKFDGGHFALPLRAGIGASVDDQALADHPYAPVSGGLDPSLG